jgi:arylsulfatase A-like enzyme
MRPLRTRAAGWCLALAALGACARTNGPHWVPLAQGFRPELSPEAVELSGGERPLRLVADGTSTDAWLETRLLRTDWKWQERVGVWLAEVELRGLGSPRDGSPPQRLWNSDVRYEHVSALGLFSGRELRPGSFLLNEGRLRLHLAEGQEPPPELFLAVYAGRGEEQCGAWRVRGRRFTAEALPVWPGERVEREVELLAPSALRFATCVEPAREPARAAPGGPGVRFRVSYDGETLFEHLETRAESVRWHEVRLPAGRRGTARLAFEVHGPFAYTSFASPFLGPADVGAPAARPWNREADQERDRTRGERQPNLIVFQADTFRADNLAYYGGTLGLTPFLDELAARSVRFRNAWSVSTYTLPAHATMFTGLWPRQAGIVAQDSAVSSGLVTIAELLSRAGYRTGAVTEATLVSHKYGLDRGFQWWDESQESLEETLGRAREFLAADDGRPVFLFLQTYRAHAPYEVSVETRAQRAELGIQGSFAELTEERAARRRAGQRLTPEEEAALVQRMQKHYWGGVADLDRGLRGFCGELRTSGLLERGCLLFTSDHGEAFYEHREVFHAGWVYEEQVRIPLFLHGNGLEPRDVVHPASLLDLAPTLADLAGVPAPPDWPGRSLLALDGDRTLLAFQLWRGKEDSTLAILEGGRKVIAFEDEEALRSLAVGAAFDLRADPLERDDRAAAGEGWPRELLERVRPALEAAMRPQGELRGAEVDAEQMRSLEALGYGGER